MITEYDVIWNETSHIFNDYKEALEMAKYFVADEIHPSRCKALVLTVVSEEPYINSKFPSIVLVEWFDDMHRNYIKLTQLM